MEARFARAALAVFALLAMGASYRTPNFIVSAPSADAAHKIGDAAEKFRAELAIEWLGRELPNWGQPCPITVQLGPQLGASGATSFLFDRGEVFGWEMNIQGPLERVLDSVLPHEVTHTIFASHFRQPLPRWADEGACTTVEHQSERQKQQRMLVDFLKTRRGIPFHVMFAMREYPQDILPLYAQGHSLATFLVAQGGRRKFISYVEDGLATGRWPQATETHYGYKNLAELQETWLTWVREGSRMSDIQARGGAEATLVAATTPKAATPANLVVRGQSADPAPAESRPLVVVPRRRGHGAESSSSTDGFAQASATERGRSVYDVRPSRVADRAESQPTALPYPVADSRPSSEWRRWSDRATAVANSQRTGRDASVYQARVEQSNVLTR